MIYWFTWRCCRFISFFLFPIKIYGKENIPIDSNFIIVSNHVSNLDPVIIPLCLTRRINFMAKESLFRVFFIGTYIRLLGAYPIRRNKSDIGAIKETLKRLKAGNPVLMFPQGTRVLNQNTKSVQPGVGFIVRKSNLPVLPLYIEGSDIVMSRQSKGIKRHTVKVVFGKLLYYSPDKEYQEIASDIMEHILKLA